MIITEILMPDKFLCLLVFLDLSQDNTCKIIWRLSNFVDGERHQVPLCALFQTQTDIREQPNFFRKLVGKFHHMKEFKVLNEIRTHKDVGQLVLSWRPLPLFHRSQING
jgi:hypothetical protein